MNALDQMREAFIKVLGQLDLTAVITVVATVVTAAATVALWCVTRALADETQRMRQATDRSAEESRLMRESADRALAESQRMRDTTERIHNWNVEVHEASKEPRFIIYMDVDEIERFEAIIFENVTDNPAYDVSLKFTPDLELNVYKAGTRKNPHLSEVGFYNYAVVAPRQRIARSFSIFTDGTGVYGHWDHFTDVDVEVCYRNQDNVERKVHLHLDSQHTRKSWYTPKNTLVALQKQMKESIGELSKAVSEAAEPRPIPPPSSLIHTVAGGASQAARIPRPARDRLPSAKGRRR